MLRLHTDLDLPAETGWIVPGIVPANGLVVLASAPKTGKSVFANAIARAVSSGGVFAGTKWPHKFPVAWCSHEETREERGPLLAGLTEADPFYLSFPPELPFLDDPECTWNTDRYGRNKPGTMPYIYSECRDHGVGLLVIDCLHAAVRYSNLADNQVARRIMGKLRHWSSAYGVATIVLHHLTKSAHRGYHPERFADSAQILAGASCHFFLESEILEDGKRKVTLHGAGRQPAPPARQEFISDDIFTFRRIYADDKPKPPSVAEKILTLLSEGWELTAEEISKRLGLNPRTVQNTLITLEGIDKVPVSRRKHRYRLAEE